MAQPRVLLADDHRAMLECVCSLLEPQFEVIGMVEDGRTLVSEARRLEPDVIVLDITMPILSGIEAARELDKAGCRARLIFLTSHTDPEYVCRCFTARGLGYVTKSHLIADLIPAIHDVLSDHAFVSPSVWQ